MIYQIEAFETSYPTCTIRRLPVHLVLCYMIYLLFNSLKFLIQRLHVIYSTLLAGSAPKKQQSVWDVDFFGSGCDLARTFLFQKGADCVRHNVVLSVLVLSKVF